MSTIAMFTKHDGDPQQTLFDLQCIWYELEVGESYARRGSDGLALKKFYAVEKHFTDFVEDQFDFHAFSIRKVFELVTFSLLSSHVFLDNPQSLFGCH